jgi:hypothetical protein
MALQTAAWRSGAKFWAFQWYVFYALNLISLDVYVTVMDEIRVWLCFG